MTLPMPDSTAKRAAVDEDRFVSEAALISEYERERITKDAGNYFAVTCADLEEDEILGFVTSVEGSENSRFAVACVMLPKQQALQEDELRLPTLVSITFSLAVWKGKYPPLKKQLVIMTGVEGFLKGWRARRARPVVFDKRQGLAVIYELSMQQPATSKD